MTDPALAVSVPGRGRMYRHPETGELYPSITNIIDVLAKPWLGGWAAKMVAGAAWDSRDALMKIEDRDEAVAMLKGAPYRSRGKKADLGTAVHAVAEASARDEKWPEIPPEAEPYVEGFLSFVQDFAPSWRVLEGTVYNVEHGYAGTFDMLAEIDGLLVLGDYKTGANVYDEVAMQLAAGRYAESLWDPVTGDLSPMPAIAGCIAIHLQPNKYAVYTVNAGAEAFEAFLGLRAAWPWSKDHGNAIGPRTNRVRLVKEFSPAPSKESNPSSNAGVRPAGATTDGADRGGTDGPASQEGRANDGSEPAGSPSPPRESGPAGAGETQEALGV